MTPDEERWAEAALALKLHGDGAPLWVAERMGCLASAGDWNGVERFRQIAGCIDRLMAETRQ